MVRLLCTVRFSDFKGQAACHEKTKKQLDFTGFQNSEYHTVMKD